MGNTFSGCIGRGKKGRTAPSHDHATATKAEPMVPRPSAEKSLKNSFGSPLLKNGSIRRFHRRDSTVRNPPATGWFLVTDAYAKNPSGSSRGSAIIFAMTDFENDLKNRFHQLADRQGVVKDASDLSTVFDSAGFDVQVLWNPTVDLVRKTLKAVIKSDKTSSSDSFLCIVLTVLISGGPLDTDDLLAFYDGGLPSHKLTNPFWKIGSEPLAGVPKVFIIDATRGLSSPGLSGPTEESKISTLLRKGKHKAAGKIRRIHPEESDLLLVQSCSDKLMLSADPRLGSYFVQKLISVLRLNALNPAYDALLVLTLLNENLRLANGPAGVHSSQNGIVITSSLRKDLHFFRG